MSGGILKDEWLRTQALLRQGRLRRQVLLRRRGQLRPVQLRQQELHPRQQGQLHLQREPEHPLLVPHRLLPLEEEQQPGLPIQRPLRRQRLVVE